MADAPTEIVMSAVVSGLAALLGVPFLHAVFMKVDLSLRDPESMNQGGIPDRVTMIFQYGSLILFGFLIFLSLARIDFLAIRLLLSGVATVIAFVVMLFCWLHYITGNCIDTL